MKLVRNLEALPAELRGGAVTIGNFDGVHVGHARIIERLLARARAAGGPAVVFTFDPHPVRVLRPAEAPPPLTWTDRKAELLDALGVDSIIAYPTDQALLSLTPEEFFQQIIRDKLDARAMVEGTNFYFGRNRTGTVDVLGRLCDASGVELEIVAPVIVEGAPVSSSRIRRLIAEGDVESACRMLVRPYRIRGLVTHGAGRGARLGCPTANIEGIDTLLPAPGVYAGRSAVGGELYAAAISVGPNPTFGEQVPKVEVHLIGFNEPIYGQVLEVDFLARLRDIQTFSGVEALKTQIEHDIERAKQVAANTG